jgi:hypothetical protein
LFPFTAPGRSVAQLIQGEISSKDDADRRAADLESFGIASNGGGKQIIDYPVQRGAAVAL